MAVKPIPRSWPFRNLPAAERAALIAFLVSL
jgi:hypothetical protein